MALDLNFNPTFGDPISKMRADAEAQGIKTHFTSGVRSAEDQRQLYANYIAGRSGQPLPYPERGAVPLAAKPGTSLHERGLAADLEADDPSQQAALWALAPKYGLTALGAKDPEHFQLASNAMVSRPHDTSSSDSSAAAPVDFRNSVYQTLIGKGLNPQQAMGAMYSLMGESGHGLDPSSFNPNDPGGAMGFAQWTGDRRAGLQATAKEMGLKENDPTAQLAYFNQELDGKYKGVIQRIKDSASSAADATRIWTSDFEAPKVNNWQARFAQGSQIGKVGDDGAPTWTTAPATTTPDAPAAPPKTVGDALAAITKQGTDAKGNETQSPLQQLGAAFSPKQQQQQQGPSTPMLQAPQDNSAMLAQPSQQLMQQVMAASAKPLSWQTTPYGSGSAGPIGTTLNSYGVS